MPLFRQVLVVDDEPSLRHVLTLSLSEAGYDVRAVSNGEEALKEIAAHEYDAVITDVRMPVVSGEELLQRALNSQPDLVFVVMSAYGGQDAALKAVSFGAFDYVQKPFKPQELLLVLQKAEERIRLIRENRRLRAPSGSTFLQSLLGQSAAMAALQKQIQKLAPVQTTVLLTGESGTGKELVARALHELSPRAGMPFVAVNCGAIPEGLIESELFGHAKGAFTDAQKSKRGLFSEADGGTLFLDEAGELPLSAQVKLLRVLQEGEVRPVGESKSEKVSVRVVAATHRDLSSAVEQGRFREDLYYRLNVVNLTLPPLRERREDIHLLVEAFLNRFNRELNKNPKVTRLSDEAQQLLNGYRWPGNVRELLNAMERGVLLADEDTIEPVHLPERLWSSVKALPASDLPASEDLSLKRAMRQLEETFIRAALRKTKGNRTRAAEILEISPRALLYKVKEYGIDPDAEGANE